MNDPWSNQADPQGEADPAVSAALAAMMSPPHGYGFWATVEDRLAAAGAPHAAAGAPPPGWPRPPTPAPADPVPAELPPARRRLAAGWWAAAAAALVLVAGAAVLVRPGSTNVATRPAGTDASEPSTTVTTAAATPLAPAPTTGAPSTTPFIVSPPRTTAPTTEPARTTTTARLASLTLSPDGLGPLHLGMTPQQAAATGTVGPFQGSDINPAGGCGSANPTGPYQSGDFSTLFMNGRLERIYVSAGSRLRTPQGIVVGTALSRLATVPGTRTESPEPYGAGTNVDILTGDSGYQFTVENGVVTAWSVGTKAGLDTPEGCA